MGRIKSLPRTVDNGFNTRVIVAKILKHHVDKKGYCRVRLAVNGIKKTFKIHRLVGFAFVDGTRTLQINHKDGDKQNNNYLNLEFTTASHNIRHAFENGLFTIIEGFEHSQSKPVKKYSKSGIYIEIFGSAGVASVKTGIQRRNICKCANNERKTAGGYIWKYN